jgi:hypothetical protein
MRGSSARRGAKRALSLSMVMLVVAACASARRTGDENVQVVTLQQKERCKSLGTFASEQRGGPDKPTAAMTKARNEVVRRGGNAIYVISSIVDWEAGATVNGEALQCAF